MRGFAMGLMWVCAPGLLVVAQLPILDESSKPALQELMSRPFGSVRSCSDTGIVGRTIADMLGPPVKAVIVHSYDRTQWADIQSVRDYLNRVMQTPLGGNSGPSRSYLAAPQQLFVQMKVSVDLQYGLRKRMEISRGFAHFEDASGCEWWTRTVS